MNLVEVLGNGADKLIDACRSHMPQVLTGICVAGIFTTGVTATVGTVKACKKIDQIKKEKGVEELSAKEVVKACWPYYIPTGVTMVVASTAGIKACEKSTAANAVFATLLQTAESSKQDILEAAEEVVGKEKKDEIEVKAAEKTMEKNPPIDDNVYCTIYGNHLFRDTLTGIFFRSTLAAVDKGVFEFNKHMVPTDDNDEPEEGEYCFEDLFKEWGIRFNDAGVHDLDKPNIWLVQDTWCTHQIAYHIVDGHHPISKEPCALIAWDNPPFDRDSLMWKNSWYD